MSGSTNPQSPSPPVARFDGWMLARIGIVLLGVAFVVWSRLNPVADNFSPMGAFAILCGATFYNPLLGMVVAFSAALISDSFIQYHDLMPATYLSFMLYLLMGRLVRSQTDFKQMVAAAFLGGLQFFIITNLAMWWYYYPRDWAGLVNCFELAIPFYRMTLASDFGFVALLFAAKQALFAALPALAAAQTSTDSPQAIQS
ncbi:DUF6580 family putative transport protein [Tuwongella immobilis]|uniref:Rod shape-determining protein MreD n=1 Tax=Tuwongella immobilis TaxID=692036 RepID=A0A6C2YS76_9BACT|nr:DUF6580 family putative transport protein [Tuwongella immobilis]VIP04520.1 Uncharacterized protein OS=Isosphaera pallida (strain ATCC 43644 / DSM 9630 / IS1B) GN=Isop_2406 PE=4 SV=1 [Tuwongella immobilis]VTS06402.1 Uncharacterized protein OS=Isosphaera pallida (strain ATCC 43644 / DSM 9630 / IS1B) GN=Isop_2406 PE=4 SV=1 [Tuwongella immobilis]